MRKPLSLMPFFFLSVLSAAHAQTAPSAVSSVAAVSSSPPVAMVSSAAPTLAAVPLSPVTMDYAGGEIPLGYHVVSRPHTTLAIVGGLVSLAGILTLVVASSIDEPQCKDDCTSNYTKVNVQILGIGELLAGAGLVIGGMAWSSEKLVRDNLINGSMTFGRVGQSGTGFSFRQSF